jgi:adenosylhomocysteine nucleosidase
MKPKLGIIVAMASEARILLERRRWTKISGYLVQHAYVKDGTDLIVARTGIGVENAITASRWLISQGAKALVSIGLAGGLSPGLKAGHLIIAENVRTMDCKNNKGCWTADKIGIAHARAVFASENVPVKYGTVMTTSEGILTVSQKESLFRKTGALAVNMESSGVAQAATEKNIPFFTMAAVCDPAEETVPQALYSCLGKKGKVQPFTLLRNLTQTPSLSIDMRRLGRHFKVARKALGKGWRILIDNNFPRILCG